MGIIPDFFCQLMQTWAMNLSRALWTMVGGVILGVFVQCSMPLTFSNNSKAVVESALSEVKVGTVAFFRGTSAVTRISSGTTVTARVDVINPKNLEVLYSLSPADPNLFSSLPPVNPKGGNRLSFDFQLRLVAEHKTVTFTLGKSVASTDKTYAPETFSVVCDSPPDPVQNLAVGRDSSNRAYMAFTLPEAATNDDLSQVILTYQDIQDAKKPGTLQTATLGVDDPSLSTAVTPDLLSSVTSFKKRYFQPDPAKTTQGHAYAFTAVLIDAVGQTSTPVSAGADGIKYSLTYDLNGGSGTLPIATDYSYGSQVGLDSGANLTWAGHEFVGWNTQANGGGTNYAPGSTVTMNTGNLVLYAQWAVMGTVGVTVGWGSYGSLSFSPLSLSLSVGKTAHISAALTGGTGWKWYVDGARQTNFDDDAFFDFSSLTPGVSRIDLTVLDSNGVLYSGGLTVTTVAGLTVTYLANGASGSAPVDGFTYADGAPVAILGNTGGMVYPGRNFEGWNTQANGLGIAYPIGGTALMGPTGLVLYAQWWGSSFTQGGVSYTVSGATVIGSDGTEYTLGPSGATLDSYAGTGSLVTVPAAMGGYPVAVAQSAFSNNTDLTSVVFSEGILTLPAGVFDSCINLTSVTLPSTLTAIPSGAFTDCTALSSFIIPASVTSIGSQAFGQCSSLTAITVPIGVTSLGAGAFLECTALASVTFDSPVPPTGLNNNSFLYCGSLTQIHVPAAAVAAYQSALPSFAGIIGP